LEDAKENESVGSFVHVRAVELLVEFDSDV
jgi:hypothetical protein